MSHPHSQRSVFQYLLFLPVSLFAFCAPTNTGSYVQLSPAAFYDSVNTTETTVLDVRTPQEFGKGHLSKAVNMDWYSGDFFEQVKSVSKKEKLFLYCLSGERSGVAARKLSKLGYNVYDLKGGVVKWKAANLPLTAAVGPAKELSLEQFNTIISSDKPVLVDFFGEWCGPCRQMKPFLEELAVEEKDRLQITTISYDDNKLLTETLKIDELPYLQYHVNGRKVWEHKGFISKADLRKKLQLNP